jgi:hypothetical protein
VGFCVYISEMTIPTELFRLLGGKRTAVASMYVLIGCMVIWKSNFSQFISFP